jgi:ATP-binding cassette subfamily B (MDR/TAP) protein 1
VFSYVPDIASAKTATIDLLQLVDAKPEIDSESSEGRVPEKVEGGIRFEDVHFRYPTRPAVRVLRGLNLAVKPGSYIALVGESGCGKSTMCV